MKRARKKEPLQVTSFRLPPDVKTFLDAKAKEQDRTKSYVLVTYIRQWIEFESLQAKQPKTKK